MIQRIYFGQPVQKKPSMKNLLCIAKKLMKCSDLNSIRPSEPRIVLKLCLIHMICTYHYVVFFDQHLECRELQTLVKICFLCVLNKTTSFTSSLVLPLFIWDHSLRLVQDQIENGLFIPGAITK